MISGGHFRKRSEPILNKLITPLSDLHRFFGNLRAAQYEVELFRIGGEGDGGYLVPSDMDGVEFCFSPGVACCSAFEEFLATRYGIRSYLADASVDGPASDNPLFDFEKKFLGTKTKGKFITLEDWMTAKLKSGVQGDGVLQMDIEGAEFGVLNSTPISLLERFRVIIVEFHAMDNMFLTGKFRRVDQLFEKLLGSFSIVHMHPNNYHQVKKRGDIAIPGIIEMVFLRNDRIALLDPPEGLSLPHPLDSTNVPERPDFTMPDIWWREPGAASAEAS